MKVLNLQCSRQHSFEGWFGSEDDFQHQLKRGLLECPLCADKGIRKMPSAPRLNFGGHQVRDTDSPAQGQHTIANVSSTIAAPASDQIMAGQPDSVSTTAQAEFLNALRRVMANTEDVGQQFAEEARRMHYGEIKARNIRGQSTAREAFELLEEGIEVMPLPGLAVLKETLQ